jgi:hypothetical protein
VQGSQKPSANLTPADDPGWFFILRERPGEPRFGFDIGDVANTSFNTWNEVDWADIGTAEGAYTQFNKSLSIVPGTLAVIAATDTEFVKDNKARHNEDLNYKWNPTTNAADVAYITYQDKVMVAIHGSEMLNF